MIGLSSAASDELGVVLAGSFSKRRAIESFIVWLARQSPAARMAFIAENEPPADWAGMEAVQSGLRALDEVEKRRAAERAASEKRAARQRGA